MSNKQLLPSPNGNQLNIFETLIRRFRLSWLLLTDSRVPIWTKIVPFFALLYLIFPFDIIPDALLGIGQLDDIGIILLGLALFVRLAPDDVVEDYLDELDGGSSGGGGGDDIVDANYRILNDKD